MGLYSNKEKSSEFNFDPLDYYGTWYEVGRYPDPEENMCNNVTLVVGPSPTGLRILRTCGCSTVNINTVCGHQNIEVNRVDDSNVYKNSHLEFKIVWTNYKTISLVSNKNKLWIYCKENNFNNLPKNYLNELYFLVKRHGYDPSKVILDGRLIQKLSEMSIYTGTLIEPYCSSAESEKYTPDIKCKLHPVFNSY